MKYSNAVMIIILILVVDQLSKIYIKTNFLYYGSVDMIGDWSKLYFIENEGMAYGMKLSEGNIGKLLLTFFRLFAVGYGFYYLAQLAKKKSGRGFMLIVALILAGAAGNLIDSIFYGVIFSESTPTQVASFVPWGEGYGSLFQGKVVDMLYFPMFSFQWPDFLPFVGGDDFLFFAPIFNVADVAISTGVISLLVFYNKLFKK